jgi:uncharacterized protein involved in response to NO
MNDPRRPASPCCSDTQPAPSRATPARPGVFVSAPTCSAATRARTRGSPDFLRDSFRPFYFGGAIFAALAVPAWLGMWYHGYFTPTLPPLYWHAHEMVFGFAAAIIVGFLFTAARNWTGLPLPAGLPLASLFSLWILGRVGMFFAYGPATAVIDSLLLLLVAVVLARKFIRARSMCSMPLVFVLLSLGLANVAFHASMHNLLEIPPVMAIEFGLMLVVLIEMIIGGRVVPGFTANAIPGVRQFRSVRLHRASFALAALAIISDALRLPPMSTGTLALLAGVAVAAQAIGWNPLATRSRPLLWVLHVSYAWIPVGLVLLGLASFGLVPRSAAIHAFAVGSIGGLIMGMITRTALGHSGRPVQAGRWETAAYVLVHAAAISRVTAALVPAVYLAGMSAAGLAWTAAFAIYAIAYAPVLIRSRPSPRVTLASN